MSFYIPFAPKQLGVQELKQISIKSLLPYINWTYLFKAWRISGKYEGFKTISCCQSCKQKWLLQFPPDEKNKAKEALKLYEDALAMLHTWQAEQSISIKAIIGFFSAQSSNEGILLHIPNATTSSSLYIPLLRQQIPAHDGLYYSLSDFVSPKSDYLGIFAVSVAGIDSISQKNEQQNDSYKAILAKTIGDRLAEAAAEYLHEQVRKYYWGYASDEQLSIEDMLKSHYQGIRPAVGYPSLPDQSIIFDLKQLLPFHKIGIKLTESGAMIPHSSICGLLISHPEAKYFSVGKISQEQLLDYAQKRHKTKEEMQKWLTRNLT